MNSRSANALRSFGLEGWGQAHIFFGNYNFSLTNFQQVIDFANQKVSFAVIIFKLRRKMA